VICLNKFLRKKSSKLNHTPNIYRETIYTYILSLSQDFDKIARSQALFLKFRKRGVFAHVPTRHRTALRMYTSDFTRHGVRLAAFLTATLRVGRPASRQAGRQASKQASKQANKQASKQADQRPEEESQLVTVVASAASGLVSISIQWQPRAISIRRSRSWFHTRHARFFAISRSYVPASMRSACVRASLLASVRACVRRDERETAEHRSERALHALPFSAGIRTSLSPRLEFLDSLFVCF